MACEPRERDYVDGGDNGLIHDGWEGYVTPEDMDVHRFEDDGGLTREMDI